MFINKFEILHNIYLNKCQIIQNHSSTKFFVKIII